MLERSVPLLKIVCLALAALMVYQFSRLAARRDPLARLSISAALSSTVRPHPQPGAKATNSVPRQASNQQEATVPLAVQGRVERITQSEILGPVIRPLPMALLGIAGRDAIVRAPNGQTGLLKEGDAVGGIKVLRIGTNRVLVEHEGQKKELMIFSGFGSETLLPKEKEKLQ